MLPEVVVSSTVQPVIPVGADSTRLLALRVSTMTSRSPAETVVGVVTFGRGDVALVDRSADVRDRARRRRADHDLRRRARRRWRSLSSVTTRVVVVGARARVDVVRRGRRCRSAPSPKSHA